MTWRCSSGRRLVGAAVAVLLGAGGGVAASPPARAESQPIPLAISGGPASATDSTPVTLDADLYMPMVTPAPAIVLAHGFGGSKQSVADEAAALVARGFVVLAYSARGFGGSTGLISMNSPQFEVADASAVIDQLAARPEVLVDAPGDPRVGVAGGSYGGALALMTAGYDRRVDAIAADITWNDLRTSLYGQSAMDTQAPGAFKRFWAGTFFSAGLLLPPGTVDACGRFTPAWCQAYERAATGQPLTAADEALMLASSPRSITDRITVPTLIGAGLADSLFPVAQADATFEQIRSAHPEVPVSVIWHAGGHDGGVSETDRLRTLSAAWFDEHLRGGPAVVKPFEVSYVENSALSNRARGQVEVFTASAYPGIDGDGSVDVTIAGPPQRVLAPAGGLPAAITSLPGVGGLASLASGFTGALLPQQTAMFMSDPLLSPVRITGSTRIRLAVSAPAGAEDAVLFASLRIVGDDGRQVLPNGLVAPIRIPRLGSQPTLIDVDLPGIAVDVAAGERLALVIGTTDQAYALPPGPAVYSVALADPVVRVPTASLTATASGAPVWVWPAGAAAALLLLWLLVRLVRPRHRAARRDDRQDTPLVVDGLAKQFGKEVHAVAGVSFEVPRGVVLGLLGPNGAGKTTTMRMVMGLITPTSGEAWVFGERVWPGAPVLARIGSFVEGSGFLPHLSGRQNLDLYWRASGRDAVDPRLDEVLEIAGLGTAIDRRVKTYSQGMRQRLGIAQAMLGLPDLLVLDEPTNGLDPPQIREMREVLRRYAADGRTVIVSSHLLSEVEQSCSHVVVMNRGLVIAQGTVAELLAGRRGERLEDVFMDLVGQGHEVVTS